MFNIKDDLFHLTARVRRPEMIMPQGTDILPLNDALDIRVDWLKSKPKGTYIFLTFFTIIWNGMIASGAFTSLVFLSVHLLVGLGLIYYLAGVYLNYTDIIVTPGSIEISQQPIRNPFNTTKTYSTQDIDQLYVHKYESSRTNDVPNYAYALIAKLNNSNNPITLIKGMNKKTQLYLEQEIERYLKISNRDVQNSIK